MKPLTPKEVLDNPEIPNYVIEAINDLLRQKYRGKPCVITQQLIVKRIMDKAPEGVTKATLVDNGYMDFEPLYKKFGWDVVYDKPGYCESGSAKFTFSENGLRRDTP